MKKISEFNEEIYEYIGDTKSLILYAMAGITFPDPTYEIENHRFPAYSIEYVYEGNGVIQQDGRIFKINAGDFFIIHPGDVHYFVNPKNPWRKVWVHISGDTKYVQNLMSIFNIENKFLHIQNLQKPLELENIAEIIKRDDSTTQVLLERYLFFMFQEINYILQKQIHDTSLAAEAKRFIDKRICSKLTINEIAGHFSVSPDYLCRTFKKKYGYTPSSYILSERLEQSKALLRQTDLSLAEIAEHFFFFDNVHFSHVFSKAVGMPPSEYRKKP